jgi:hypothetical protein
VGEIRGGGLKETILPSIPCPPRAALEWAIAGRQTRHPLSSDQKPGVNQLISCGFEFVIADLYTLALNT